MALSKHLPLNNIRIYATDLDNQILEKAKVGLYAEKRLSDDYELIDGQQRLTTVYLILFYLNQDFVENKRDLLFEIDYETRKGTKDFLKKPQELNDTNIDFYYISRAYKTIEDWFEKKDQDFDKGAFRSKIKFNCKGRT